MDSPLQQPTRVRYGVMGYLCSLAFILYIDRVCIGQAGPVIQEELNISNTMWGWVGVAFQIAYAIFEPTTGHWGDKYGSRRVLIRVVLWWSAFTALTGCVFKFSLPLFWGLAFNGYALLLLIRFLFGAGEAGALPNAARIISVWFPPGKRGPAQAMISTAAQVGGAAAPFLASIFIESPYIGWRLAFVIFGSLGLVWIWFFARGYHDDPTTHPKINEAERDYIMSGRNQALATLGTEHQIPWRLVAANSNIWLLGIINACTSSFSYMLFLWFPKYLKDGRGLDGILSGRIGALPYLFGATGVMLGGFLGDWITKRVGSRRLALGGMGTTGLLLAGLLVGSSQFIDNPLAAVLMCSLGYFCSYIQLAAWWAAMADVGGRHLGALFGLCNMIGLGGGAVSQLFVGWFIDRQASLGLAGRVGWDPMFYVYGVVLMLGGVLWFFINPAKSVVAEDSIALSAADKDGAA
jgi:MFS family permease